MRTSRGADLTVAGLLVGLAAVVLWETTRWPAAVGFAGDPLILPRALAVLMTLVAVAIAVPALRGSRRDASPEDGAKPARALFCILAGIAFAALLERLGLILAAMPFVLILQRIAGAPWRLAVPVAIAAPLAIWAIFAMGLNVPLPAGPLASLLGR